MNAKKNLALILFFFSAFLLTLFVGILTVSPVAAAGRCYVDASAGGAATGVSWTDAYTNVQDALSDSCTEIWVAGGVYYPDEGGGQTNNDPNATFTLKDGVALYGGFVGTETALSERDPATHVTVLSGDIDKNDTTDAHGVVTDTVKIVGSNAYHVISGSSVTGTARLDGFTITAGTANGSYPATYGGGMYNTGSSNPTLTNLTFSGNSATSYGGGMFNDSSSPTLTNVTFSANSATYGGGMSNENGSSPTLTNVTFSANSATIAGGGMVNIASSPALTNVTFSANRATIAGGGMANDSSSPTLTNTLIANSTRGGDCVGSIAGGSTNNLIEDSGANACGLTDGVDSNIVGQDPKLGPLADNGGSTLTHALLGGSPAIDAGTNTGCPTTDQRGVSRPFGATCDIGAYEFPSPIYVKAGASGAATGVSWTDAFTNVQDALLIAGNGTEIWVAAGVYYPDEGSGQTDNDRSATFTLKAGVAIYGGFGGTETALSERDPATHVTVLSGDIGQDDTTDAEGVVTDTANIAGSNAYHVVKGGGVTDTARLDGFTITAGQATGSYPAIYGGGMYNKNGSSPTLTNLTFSGNSATYGGGMYNAGSSSAALTNITFSGNSATDGGGIYSVSSNLTLTDVTFSANSAATFGGAMLNAGSSPTMTDVILTGNSAIYGGGMYNLDSRAALTNVTFSANSAATSGGGMENYNSSPTLTNLTFSGNRATYGGGMFNNNNSSPALTNVTFSANRATTSGGGMYNVGSSAALTNTLIANSTSGGDCVNGAGGSITSASHNLIEDSGANACGLTDGVNGNIIGQDPKLGPLADNGGSTVTHALLVGSPAIDAGTNTGCPATDQRGVIRPIDGDGDSTATCDIGAYEFLSPIYVKAGASGAATGVSWTDAFTNVQDALLIAGDGTEIWVAAGVYYPDEGGSQTDNDRSATFTLKAGVAMYGGFAGTETALSERDPATHVTVLSGDIGQDDITDAQGVVTDTANITGTNAYHVVSGGGVTGTARLDGFTITAGQANGSYPANAGGGMYNSGSSPTLTNLTFSGNSAALGGGMYNASSSPTLTDVTFSANSAARGGGMYNDSSSPTLTDVTFSGNSAPYGGYGGGMYNSSSSPTLTNLTFSANSATYGGGMFNGSSSSTLTNVTFSGNSATYGGGMYNIVGSSPALTNTLIANSASGGDCVGSIAGGSTNNLIEDSGANACGLTGGSGNIVGQAPKLGPLADNGGSTLTHALLPGSPAVDAGTNTGCPATDQRGVSRPQGAACDIGAYEFVYQIAISDTSVSEGDSGTVNAVFAVTLNLTATAPVTVTYATADGTATAGSDYDSATGTLTFQAGERQKTITVGVRGDTAVESDETFTVNLSNAQGAEISDNQAIGTIVNDDVPNQTPTPTNTSTNTPTSTPIGTPASTPTNTPTSTPTNTPTSTPISHHIYLPLLVKR